MSQEKELYTLSEIAKMFGKSVQAIHMRVLTRKVPYQTFGKTKVIEKENIEKLELGSPR